MIVDKINLYLATNGKELGPALLEETGKLASWAFKRQFGLREERESTQPYFSSIGKCTRQQAYKLLKFPEEGRELGAKAKMIFFQGDMVELAVIQLAKIAGCNITLAGSDQEASEWNGLRGRPDGIYHDPGVVIEPATPTTLERRSAENYVLEIKSMASYTFERFEQGQLEDSYRYQCNAAMASLGPEKSIIIAQNKDAGVLAEMIIQKDPAIVADILKRLGVLAGATKEKLPERGHAPNEKGFYPWQCNYCGYWKICLKNKAEQVVVRGKYQLKELKGDIYATA